MDTKEFLNRVCQEIKYKPAKRDISEEMETHIQDLKENYIHDGFTNLEAEEKAVAQMGNAEEIGKKLNKIHRPKLEWKLLILILILMGFEIFTLILKQPLLYDYKYYLRNAIIYIIIGLILSVGIYFFDYKKIKNYSNIIFAIATIIMILPIILKGPTINGTYYIRGFNINIFPPTIALPLYIISIIGCIVNYDKRKIHKIEILNRKIVLNMDSIKIAIFCIISLVLMLSIPSMVDAIMLGIVYLIILTIKIWKNKESRLRRLSIMYGVVFIVAGFILYNILVVSPFRSARFIGSFYPELDPDGFGYTGMLQKEIIENSKLIGEADTEILKDPTSIINVESNFTFIYILGKAGILIAGILVFTIILISVKLIIDARKIKELYGKLLIIGLSSIYILQSFATILMNLNLGIQTNLNLPFVTYGGVNLFVNLFSIALILSIYRRKDINEYDKVYERKKINLLEFIK